MNYKQLIQEIKNTKKAVLIDKQEAERGNNKVRILRFFFCGNFKPLVEKLNAIGFYLVIEKRYYSKDYEVYIKLITKEQEVNQDTIFFEISNSATELYNKALDKIKEMSELKQQEQDEEREQEPSFDYNDLD